MARANSILYISYNGIDEPLVESQVLAYLRSLSRAGFRFVLLTFERQESSAATRESTRARLANEGIDWHCIVASRGGGVLSAWMNVWRGCRLAKTLAREQSIRLIHARSFIPALIAYRLKRSLGLPFVNDLRGFWVDEKVYRERLRAGGTVYRSAKWIEAQVLRASDCIISLSDRGQQVLRDSGIWKGGRIPAMVTIPTCVDLDRFVTSQPRPAPPFVFGYVGSLSAEYLPDEIMRYFAAAMVRFPGSRLHLVSRSDPGPIRLLATRHAIPQEVLRLVSAAPAQVAAEVAQFHIALSFIRPHFAKIASCPTKVGEYLAAGVPVVSNSGIGDLDQLLGDSRIGCLLREFDAPSFDRSFRQIEDWYSNPGLSAQCRDVARLEFSLPLGVQRYASVYRSLIKAA